MYRYAIAEGTWKARFAFMTSQLIFTIATLIPAIFCFQYYWVNVFVLVLIFSVSVWNGAGYYIEVRPKGGYSTYFTKSKSVHTLKRLALPRACHSGGIALAGSRHLRSTLAAAPVLFAHAVVTEIKTSRIITPSLFEFRGQYPTKQCRD